MWVPHTPVDVCTNINDWNVSRIKDMSKLFHDYKDFNMDISNWDVSNVENMEWMFHRAYDFNQDGTWDKFQKYKEDNS